MPNILDANGLTLATRAELLANFTAGYQAIYGSDINLGSDTPDGQAITLFMQSVLDLQDLLNTIYNSFDPDNAVGVTLDQRVAINGIQRQAGTYTVTPITIVTSQSVNLFGLDQTAELPYTVSDNAGNLWVLQVTQLGVAAGTNAFNFQAATPGAQLTVPNTITIQVTIVLGVTSVNNPTTYTTLGINEESDAALKLRRQKSVSLGSQGYLQGLLGALENIEGVTSANVYENVTGSTDVDSIPGHSIWCILAGSGAAADIAQAIYQKRNAGCGMKHGAESYDITQVDGTIFTVYWDDVVAVNLFINFTATSINGTASPNIALIKSTLPTSFTPGVYQEENINGVATLIQVIDPNTLATSMGLSDGQSQILTLSGVAASGTFVIRYNGNSSAAISWNDSISTIQTKVQAVTGLSAALVTGSIASQSLNFNLTNIDDVLALIYVVSNSLQTSGPVAITFSYNYNYENVITPASKKFQFVIQSDNIIILPMQLTPTLSAVIHGNTETFTGLGGYGTLVYSILTNVSGGSINSSTGVYTAGSTPGTDVVKVIDVYGNFATANVVVT